MKLSDRSLGIKIKDINAKRFPKTAIKHAQNSQNQWLDKYRILGYERLSVKQFRSLRYAKTLLLNEPQLYERLWLLAAPWLYMIHYKIHPNSEKGKQLTAKAVRLRMGLEK